MAKMKGLPALATVTVLTVAVLVSAGLGSANGAQQERLETKRVLLLFSYHEGLTWEKLIEESFRNTLASQSGFPIEINVEHTDGVRYADDEYRNKLVDLYRHKYSHPKMDLVIGIDDEAAGLLLDFSGALFPDIPIVLVTAESKNDLRGLLKPNMTSILWGVDFRSNVELIGDLLPQTRQIFIVAGTSQSDQEALKLAQNDLKEDSIPFAIHYLTDISAEDLLNKVTQLPKQSAVLYVVFSRDADGKDFVPRDILSILSKNANAPVFGVISTYLGFGALGGKMLSAEMEGKRCAEIALHILRSEPLRDRIPKQMIHQLMFDWRQLKRWGISEKKLPPGSIVQYKTNSFWDLYRGRIVAVLVLLLFQSWLILFLLKQRVQRRRAQERLAESLSFEEMLAELSARFVNLPPDRVDKEIEAVLEIIGSHLDVNRISIFQISPENQKLQLIHSYRDVDTGEPPLKIELQQIPWIYQKLLNAEIVAFSDLDNLHADASIDKDFLRTKGTIAALAIPLFTENRMLGALALSTVRHSKIWSNEVIRQCRLVGEVFTNALVRKQHEESLVRAEAKYRAVADFTYDWEFWINPDDSLEYVSPSCERISGYTPQDFINQPSLLKEIIVPEDREMWNHHCHESRQHLRPHDIHFRIWRRDGEMRWIEHNCQPVVDAQGQLQGLRASNRDITARKMAEVDLHKAYSEIEQLKNKLEAETAYLQAEIKLEHNFENIIGNSAALKYVLYKVEQVATADSTVLILGESGTGKELIARAIHSSSLRKGHPLVKVNCATLPSNLIESELFGHERGAFTGAQTRHLGRFEVADGATLFLDEIGELPLELQTKLLRVLQEGEFERLGSTRTIKVDVRVIAATNRNLDQEVRQGRFREDLFYRLNVFPITVPPLRQRADDIPLLAWFFVERASKRLGKSIEQIPESVIQKFQAYDWPGNVRELENVIERAVINSSGPKLRLADALSGTSRTSAKQNPPTVKSLQEMEKEHIVRVLDLTNWRIDGNKGAALILDMNPSTLRSRMRKLEIQKP